METVARGATQDGLTGYRPGVTKLNWLWPVLPLFALAVLVGFIG